jgi:hypothetical protein
MILYIADKSRFSASQEARLLHKEMEFYVKKNWMLNRSLKIKNLPPAKPCELAGGRFSRLCT